MFLLASVPSGRRSLGRRSLLDTRKVERIGVAVAAMLISIGGRATAESAPADTTAITAGKCVDFAMPTRFVTNTFYQTWLSPGTIPSVADQLDLVSEHIAEQVRTALGGASAIVPKVDSLVTWQNTSFELPLVLVLRRDQATTWRAEPNVSPTQSKLLAVYLDVLHKMAPDDLWIVWPKNFAPDSLVLRLYVAPPDSSTYWPGVGGRKPELQIALFSSTIGVVPKTSALPDHQGQARYPVDAERHGVTATVIMQFVIDTAGHADSATITNVKPAGGTFNFPNAERYYREFVAAARQAVLATTYHPAQVGSCRVRQLVLAPYTFAPPRQ